MKIAIMQPYAFPYIGYFYLISSVDQFVFFDDVNFIKKGYINRNSISLSDSPHRFTLPVLNQSQNRPINQHYYVGQFDNFLNVVRRAYSKFPYFYEVYDLISHLTSHQNLNVAKWNSNSIIHICQYLGISTNFSFSSDINSCNSLSGQNRILCLCRHLKASHYLNPPGGKTLYTSSAFQNAGVSLSFLNVENLLNSTIDNQRLSSLSIIDLLMKFSPSSIREILNIKSFNC